MFQIAMCRPVNLISLPAEIARKIPEPGPDDTVDACLYCRDRVYLTPEKAEMVQRHLAVILCTACCIYFTVTGSLTITTVELAGSDQVQDMLTLKEAE